MESEAALGEIAKLLQVDPGLKLHFVGHTDGVGSLPDDLKRSQSRADEVVRSLVFKRGVAAGRLTGNGVGPLEKVASNDAEWAKNRRVEPGAAEALAEALAERLRAEDGVEARVVGPTEALQRLGRDLGGVGDLLEGLSKHPMPVSIEVRPPPGRRSEAALSRKGFEPGVAAADWGREWVAGLERSGRVVRGIGALLVLVCHPALHAWDPAASSRAWRGVWRTSGRRGAPGGRVRRHRSVLCLMALRRTRPSGAIPRPDHETDPRVQCEPEHKPGHRRPRRPERSRARER